MSGVCLKCKAKNQGRWKFCTSCGAKNEKNSSTFAAYHFIVMGTGGVGKSAITIQFINRRFEDRYDPTIEDRYSKVIEYEGIQCFLEIFDTAGQETFSAMRELYMKNGEGFILVFSLSSEKSLEELITIHQGIMRYKGTTPVAKVLIGNKKDLKREISINAGKDLATKWGCPYIETSAKLDDGIQETFLTLIRETWKISGGPKKRPKNRCILF
eukprot:TRINITY_DN1581_c0_g1_i1.p1 TRINITY_DN1581_c0_g1~~TRINITY_DN1581_c0_g1_i1.p1  ORF type:complete len:213 (+),score=30.61 TRINITY_DN1581_c0_g1_i1:37-675(+)